MYLHGECVIAEITKLSENLKAIEDLNTAKKLLGKYRMVTLSGDLIEKSRNISGGAFKPLFTF